MHYLWSDCETGGKKKEKHPLLQAYFAVYNDKMEFVDELELFLKPDEGDHTTVCVEQEALDVTGINIEEHFKSPNTITYTEGRKLLLDFLTKHKIPNKRKHFRLSGHNVAFDLGFINTYLLDEDEWEKLVHYLLIDTLRICTFLQDCGLIAGDIGNLGSLVEYFGIPKDQAHNARGDIKMNVGVYKALLQMMKERKNNMSGISEHNLLSIVEL